MGTIIKYDDKTAAKEIIERCRTMARLRDMDNGIPPPTDEEMYLALEDALNYINSFPPQTGFTPSELYNNTHAKKHITLVCYGTLWFTFQMLIAYISANLMDVVIDEFPISSRLAEYTQLAEYYHGLLDNKLAQEKQIMGSIIRGYSRQTTLYISFSGWISKNTENRYIRSMRNGGRVVAGSY